MTSVSIRHSHKLMKLGHGKQETHPCRTFTNITRTVHFELHDLTPKPKVYDRIKAIRVAPHLNKLIDMTEVSI